MDASKAYSGGKTLAGNISFPPIRGDIKIWEGPVDTDGSPTWTLYDPVMHRCIRIGWLEGEILKRWESGPEKIAVQIGQETILKPTSKDILDFYNFLLMSNVLQVNIEQQSEFMAQKLASKEHSPLAWAMHNYLFLRIKLVNPDKTLDKLFPFLGWLFSRFGLFVFLTLGIISVSLAFRQKEAFIGGLIDNLSPQGFVSIALAFGLCKIIHEIGHGIASKKFGVRVPGAGIAFMVLWPVLWVDTTEAWKLKKKSQRLLIDTGGMLAELLFAFIMVILWAYLPDGNLRSAALIIGGTAWVTTLIVNLNPFMRFDGYYILSDALGIPNLQERGFALARWKMRCWLLGSKAEPPEKFEKTLAFFIILWAWATWIWRAILFLGIALLVYHFAFKSLGIVLMIIELWYFIFAPIFRELKEWTNEVKSNKMNIRFITTCTILILLIIAFVTPWTGRVTGYAIMRPEQSLVIKVIEPGSIVYIKNPNTPIAENSVIVEMESYEIEEKLKGIRAKVEGLESALIGQSFDIERRGTINSSQEEAARARAEVSSLEARKRTLIIKSPFDGILVDMPNESFGSNMLPRNEILGTLISNSRIAEGYIDETDLNRVKIGARGYFLPEDGSKRIELNVAQIAAASVTNLESKELASNHGGSIRVFAGPQGVLIPETAIYKVILTEPKNISSHSIRTRGVVVIAADSESYFRRIYRWAYSIFVKEWVL